MGVSLSPATRRCSICGRRDRTLHGGRQLLNSVPQDVFVQRNRPGRIGWVICKAGGLLCLDHPKLHASVKPEEAMTPSNPQWVTFTQRLEWRLALTLCKSGRDKTQATAVLSGMGMSRNLVNASLAYFESHGGFCDCEVIYNIAMAHRLVR